MKTVVIGVGNKLRGDDAAGRAAARAVAALHLPGIDVQESNGECLSLIELWESAERVIVVDAVQSGAEPGTVHRFDATSAPLPAEFVQPYSTHALSLVEAVELARSLERLPSALVVYGIEARHFEHGEPMSAAVEQSLAQVVESIRDELASPTTITHP